MPIQESETCEFKRRMTAGALKSVVAFANTAGGTLYIGITDSGRPVGIDDVDAEMTRISSMIRDSIKPDVVMNSSIAPESWDGKTVIAIRVARGTKRPYYLASKGLCPEGVYVRSGAMSVPATDTAILQMVKESDGETWETQFSLDQSLTFEAAGSRFRAKGLAIGKGSMRTLGMTSPDGRYTNLALLLSDQCPPFIKAAAFSDDDRRTFTEREEFSGSLFEQLDGAYAFLDRHNLFSTRYEGLVRTDYRDYPEQALREALVNAVAHREYALSGPTLVSCMPSGITIVSLGGLPLGIAYPDLDAGISMPRNRLLANVLFRLELIEAYGTGIGRMRSSYAESGLSPEISVTPNTFAVSLPNRNVRLPARSTPSAEEGNRLLALLKKGPTTRAQIQRELGLSQSSAIRLIESHVANGTVKRIGGGRSTRYELG